MTRLLFPLKSVNFVRLFLVSSIFIAPLVTIAPRASANGADTTVLSGLLAPAETVTSSQGDVFFTQLVSSAQVDIFSLAPGSHSPVDVFRLIGLQPYINDIHVDSSGNLLFITSVATASDGSARHWDLTRLDSTSGVATVLVTTSGAPSALVPPNYFIGVGGGLTSGTEIDLAGVDSAGTIYFSEHSIVNGNQVAYLLALQPGSSTPTVVATFDLSGYDSIEFVNVASRGDVFFIENGSLHQYSTSGLRVLIPKADGPGPAGVDAAGNLYVLETSRVDSTGFGCATSTTESVVRFSAQSLWSTTPVPEVVSQATYDGFVAHWFGSSSFFRASNQGNVYWVQTSISCLTKNFTPNKVMGSTRGGGQAVLYQENGNVSSPDTQGPIGIATFGAFVYIASVASGSLLRITN